MPNSGQSLYVRGVKFSELLAGQILVRLYLCGVSVEFIRQIARGFVDARNALKPSVFHRLGLGCCIHLALLGGNLLPCGYGRGRKGDGGN